MPKPNYVFERLVTAAEANKGHITIIASHHARFKKTFGPIYFENETAGKPELARKPFFIEKATDPVHLKLVFRSPDKNGKPRNELRLYFNKGKGQFKPAAKMTMKAREAWRRDKSMALKCLTRAHYTCEAGFTNPSFIAKKKKRYLEVHHLVPLRYQTDLVTFNLNDPANLFTLSPHAHRQIHYGELADVRGLIDVLLDRRPALLTEAKLPKDTILGMYKCR